LFAQQRWEIILNKVDENGTISVKQLVEEIGVSESTIRRDLLEMDAKGILTRTHGGAISEKRQNFEQPYQKKESLNYDEKNRIGHSAARLIQDYDTVLLDSGTTNLEVARNITAKNVTVVTNSIDIAYLISNNEQVDLVLLGGNLRSRTRALVGSLTEDNLSNFKVDKVFVGVNGISIQDGISTPNMTESYSKKAMIRAANQVIVVSDSTKFGKSYFGLICPIQDIDTVITSEETDHSIIKEFEKHNIKMIIAK